MTLRCLVLAGFAAGLLSSPALAQEEAATPLPTTTAAPTETVREPLKGEKEYKERINVVARKPHRHDVPWIDGRDRTGWRTFTTWQGIRDERPMVARKTLGFHEPRPHLTRAERVQRMSRGPLRGPAPSE